MTSITVPVLNGPSEEGLYKYTNRPIYFSRPDQTRLGWSQSTQDVSSSEGYAFVPTDPFRAAEKELRRKLNKHALTNSSKTSKRDQRSSKEMIKNLFLVKITVMKNENI